MTSILKRVGIERPNLVKENAFYATWLLKMRNILLWNVTHFQHIEILFFDDLEEIVPSFSSKNVDEKFSFIKECKNYVIARVCITNICIMNKARDTLVKDIKCPLRTYADNACCDGY